MLACAVSHMCSQSVLIKGSNVVAVFITSLFKIENFDTLGPTLEPPPPGAPTPPARTASIPAMAAAAQGIGKTLKGELNPFYTEVLSTPPPTHTTR